MNASTRRAPRATVRLMCVRIGIGLVAVFASLGCSERTTNLASSKLRALDAAAPLDAATRRDAGPHDASASAADARPPFVLSDAGIVYCGDVPCVCTNGLDDDRDGLTDGFDPECTGPYDQDEATFATGEPLIGNQRCRDCFFDGNGAPGDDGCRIAASCMLDGTPAGGTGACKTCTPTAACVNNCLPRTPNGCDCFGCCEVQTDAGPIAIELVDTCSLTDLKDAKKCPRCTPSTACKNECERCELCPGRRIEDLPPDCATGSGPGYTCESSDVCSPSLPCGDRAYCSQGCCVAIVI